MSLFHTSLKAGASLVLLVLAASPAHAIGLSGGGSSLIGPAIAQIYCARVGGFSASGPCTTPIAASTDRVRLYNNIGQQNIVPTPGVIPPDSTNVFQYLISNSASGQRAILTVNGSELGTYPSGVSPFPFVNFGYSDAALSADALNAYANTGLSVDRLAIGDLGITLCAKGSSTCTTNASTATYANPQSSGFGPLVQIPLAVVPVAIGYNPANLDLLVGPLKLSKATYCGIFNGTIINWTDSAIASDNGGPVTSLSSLPIKLVGRTDGSGTTSIFTHHMEAACHSVAGNQFTNANLSGGAYKNIPTILKPNFLTLQGSSAGEVSLINSTVGAIGYVGADYATPSGAVATTVQSALLLSDDGNYYDPSAANALTAFGSIAPPSGSARLDPANWVPAIPANPWTVTNIANPSTGYNIVGTTNIILYQWYGSATLPRVQALVAPASSGSEGFLRWYYRNGDGAPATIMGNANLGILPSNWSTAIADSFIDGTDGLRLCIRTTQAAACGQ